MCRFYVRLFWGVVLTAGLGCSPADFQLVQQAVNPAASQRAMERYGQWRRSTQKQLEVFLGKPIQDVEAALGKPTIIRKDEIRRGNDYAESWYYVFSKGIPLINRTSWSYTFYVNKNVVELIDVF